MEENVKVWYDFEFIENGSTIVPISLGMVRSDNAEYYAVNSDIYDDDDLKAQIEGHQWLMENVVPNLPVTSKPEYRAGENHRKWGFLQLDMDSVLVKPPRLIRAESLAFLTELGKPQLNGWYCAYGHVCLMQMWGPMIRKPEMLPMWSRDLKQEADRLGNPTVPEQEGTEHNALHDARHIRHIDRYLEGLAAIRGQTDLPSDLGPCPQHPGEYGDH